MFAGTALEVVAADSGKATALVKGTAVRFAKGAIAHVRAAASGASKRTRAKTDDDGSCDIVSI